MKSHVLTVLVLLLVCSGMLFAGGEGEKARKTGAEVTEAEGRGPDPWEEITKLENSALSKSPNGEDPVLADALDLTKEEMEKIREMDATAAIVFHDFSCDWPQGQLGGLRYRLGELGIDIIAVTSGEFRPEKQVNDIETVLMKKPDVMISIPCDPVVTAGAHRKAYEQGIKIVLMDNVPQGFQAGREYISCVSSDNYGDGAVAMHMIAGWIGKKGKIGALYHAADFYSTAQRWVAAQDVLKMYPDIELVEITGMAGPNFMSEAERAAAAMLTKHPDLKAIWCCWDQLAEGVMAAARSAGRDDLVASAIDYGKNAGISIAQGGVIRGLAAQLPYDQGVAEATLAGYALLGKEAPPYILLPPLAVFKENAVEAYERVYHWAAPADLLAAAEKGKKQ